MKKLNYVFLALLLYTASVFAQGAYTPFSVNERKTSTMPQAMKDAVDGAKIVDVNLGTINQILANKHGQINMRIPLENNTYDVTLEKFDILNSDSRIVGGTVNGDRDFTSEVQFVSYTTPLHDKNSPMVVISITPNELSAVVISNGETFVMARTDRNDINSDYIFFASSKVKIKNDFVCGTDAFEIPQRIKDMQRNLSTTPVDFATADILKANIAIESDYNFFTVMNGTQNATNYILRLMSPVSAIYTRDMNIQLKVTYLRVWETSADPYSDATSSNTLLNEFRNYWNTNMASVPRALAHFITNRPGGLGGIAWLDVLCAPSGGYGYAFSDIDAIFNPLPTYSWDVMVVSHETGHNFGSPHTHACSWPGGPIDSCYQTEGGCYSGPAIPRIGTIMSYCHLNGSISLSYGFGPLPMQLIRSRAENASCMTSSTGYVVALPNGGEIFRSGNSVLVVWGTSNTGNVDVDYSSNNGSNWLSIGTNIPAQNRNMTWAVPYVPTTSTAKIRVYQSGNPSSADQSDSVFQVRPSLQQFNMISPPQLTRITVYANDTTRFNFTWTKSGTLPEIKYKININNFSNSINYNQFSNNSGTDTIVSITLGKLDSIAASWGAVQGDSIRGRWLTKSYSQYDSLSPSTSSFLITFVRSIIGINPISSVIPREYFVNPNYPNPFNPTTKIKFGLPKQSFVKITVYDVLGKEISILANELLKAGEFEADWDASNFPSGVYFYKVEAGDFVKTAKMILIK